MATVPKPRIDNLDLLRGIVMVIMALDHVRDFFHYGMLFGPDPTDMATTTPVLFFTRWITHYCAPIFVFLAGTSAFLYGRTRSTAQLSRFLWTRGLWMIFVELVIVGFGWEFDPLFRLNILGVFWAIGVSMLALSVLVHLPYRVVLFVGIAIVGLHNLLDHVPIPMTGTWGILFNFLHRESFLPYGEGRMLFIVYPVLPWIGTMALGYGLGRLYSPEVSSEQRKRSLLRLGFGAVLFFIGVRALNGYGDLKPWVDQPTAMFDLLSFLNTTKYPPSLLYLCMTLGPALLFLGLTEGRSLKWGDRIIVFGRVPFFYYMLHIYLIHALAIVAMVMQGFPWTDGILEPSVPGSGLLADHGFPLWVVYLVWIAVVTALYFPCRWYACYRAKNKEKWWLSYL